MISKKLNFSTTPYNIILIIAAFFLYSCNEQKRQEALTESQKKLDTIKNITSLKSRNDISLLGIWSKDESPLFEVTKDSIYYIDQDISYKYLLDHDKITIYYDDFDYHGEIKLQDSKTLIIKDSLNINQYYRE